MSTPEDTQADPNASTVVVVADDEPTILMLCELELELGGYESRSATSEAEIAKAMDSQVAAVLLDVRLGSEDGIEIARRLRRDQPSLPVILMSASIDRFDQETIALVDGILHKPFLADDLVGALRTAGVHARGPRPG